MAVSKVAPALRGAMDRRDAASYLSISTRLLDQLATDGKVRRLKQGRKTLFRVSDLDAYLQSLVEAN